MLDADPAREVVKDEMKLAMRERNQMAWVAFLSLAALVFFARSTLTIDTLVICGFVAFSAFAVHRVLTGIRIDGLRREMQALEG